MARIRASSPRLVHPFAALAVVVLALAALGACGGDGEGTGTVRTPGAVASQFGIAAGGVIERASDEDLARELEGYLQLGVGWIRLDAKWGVIEARPGRYDWSAYDRVVAAASSRGLRVLLVVGYPPDWAVPGGVTSRIDPDAYARFAAAVVRRYEPRGVRHYELWNEPNGSVFWVPRPDAAAYVGLLRAVYPAMKEASPGVTILAGSFTPVGGRVPPACEGGQEKIAPIEFLEEMYRLGAGDFFDAVSYHPYTGRALPGEEHPCNPWHQMAGTTPSLRSVMEANGDADKELWATEFGGPADELGEAHQAALVRDAVRLWPQNAWAGPLFVYTYRDASTEHRYDLVHADWSPRPAWQAYREALAELARG